MTQLTMKDKIGYGLGDTACGFVWQATMFLLAYFYTDVFGLSAGIMGTLFLVSRVLDAVTDPLMGLLVDRTRTRHGQFRPFLLWGAIPFGIVCMLTFYTPDFSAQGKIIYACVTYILLTWSIPSLTCRTAPCRASLPPTRKSVTPLQSGASSSPRQARSPSAASRCRW